MMNKSTIKNATKIKVIEDDKHLASKQGLHLAVAGKPRLFDIRAPQLPDQVKGSALTSGNYPYDKKINDKKIKPKTCQRHLTLL